MDTLFHQPFCPTCGAEATATVELLIAHAEIERLDTGAYTYTGRTQPLWDTQIRITPEGPEGDLAQANNEPDLTVASVLVTCGEHEWWTVIEEVE